MTGKCHFCFVRSSKDLTHVYSSKWPEVLCSFVAEPFPLLLVQLLFLCQVEHVTPWRNSCGFQPAILLDFVWLFRGRNGMAQKVQVGISSCSVFSGPTSRNITRTLGKLRGYMGFSSNFSLYFLFCIRPVVTVCFLSYFKQILGIYCCTCNIHMQYL